MKCNFCGETKKTVLEVRQCQKCSSTNDGTANELSGLADELSLEAAIAQVPGVGNRFLRDGSEVNKVAETEGARVRRATEGTLPWVETVSYPLAEPVTPYPGDAFGSSSTSVSTGALASTERTTRLSLK